MVLLNYKNNCRICLKPDNIMKNVYTYTAEGYKNPLVPTIFALFKIELHLYGDYSQFMCRKCVTEMENILLFMEDVVQSQDFLFDLFKAAHCNDTEQAVPVNVSKSGNIAQAPSFQTYLNHNTLNKGYANSKHENINSESKLKTENRKFCNRNSSKNSDKESVHDKTTIEKSCNLAHAIWPFQCKRKSSQNFFYKDFVLNNGATPVKSTTNNAEYYLPQAMFLQNLDLITMQDAEVLRTNLERTVRTPRKCAIKKHIQNKIIKPETENPILNPKLKNSIISSKNRKKRTKICKERVRANRKLNFVDSSFTRSNSKRIRPIKCDNFCRNPLLKKLSICVKRENLTDLLPNNGKQHFNNTINLRNSSNEKINSKKSKKHFPNSVVSRKKSGDSIGCKSPRIESSSKTKNKINRKAINRKPKNISSPSEVISFELFHSQNNKRRSNSINDSTSEKVPVLRKPRRCKKIKSELVNTKEFYNSKTFTFCVGKAKSRNKKKADLKRKHLKSVPVQKFKSSNIKQLYVKLNKIDDQNP